MTLPKIARGDAVEIVWIDSSFYEGGAWVDEDSFLGEKSELAITTVGIFLKRARKTIKLCGDRYGNDDIVIRTARCFEIPIGCVKKIRRLR